MTIVAVILLIVLILMLNRVQKKIRFQDEKMKELLDEADRASAERNQLLELLKQRDSNSERPEPYAETFETSEQTRTTEALIAKPLTEVQPEQEPAIEKQASQETKKELEPAAMSDAKPKAAAYVPPVAPMHKPEPAKSAKPRKPSFMERNPDLEKFIGENLLSKIGIVIFVIGMGFLVKLGIDNGIITEGLRVLIGVVIGGGLIGIGHYLRNSFRSFSSVLIGGALAVLYFTIALAFHEYEILSQTAAFAIMVFITIIAVVLSIAYDRKELAVLAIIGGFGTPFFLSTGEGNIAILFTYILILDVGMLALVNFKKWNIINYLAYGFTFILFISVFFTKYLDNVADTRAIVFGFLTAFYVLFFLMNVLYNVRNKLVFKYSEIIILLSNSAIYFGFGLAIFQDYLLGKYTGAFTAIVALFNFAFAYTLYRRQGVDKNLLFLLIGLVLTFVSLIGPIQLEGNYITLFWSIEAVLLMWLAKKSGVAVMKTTAAIVGILMLISLVMDWNKYYTIYSSFDLSLFINRVFVTSVVSLGALVGLMKIMEPVEQLVIRKWLINWPKELTKLVFGVVLFLTFLLELNYQFERYEFSSTLHTILLGIYIFTFIIGTMIYERLKPDERLAKIIFGLSAMAILLYATLYTMSTGVAVRIMFNGTNTVATGFYWHYLLLVLFLAILHKSGREFFGKYGTSSMAGKIGIWIVLVLGVFVCSSEASHISLLYQSGSGKSIGAAYDAASKSVFPVVWGIFALLLMIFGMRKRIKTLRIASLVLFGLTILKLFIFDLAGNTTGKIVSFIVLGIILLVISFLYQKLKFIIQDDEKTD